MLNDKGVMLTVSAMGTQEPLPGCKQGGADKERTLINLCCWLVVPLSTFPRPLYQPAERQWLSCLFEMLVAVLPALFPIGVRIFML